MNVHGIDRSKPTDEVSRRRTVHGGGVGHPRCFPQCPRRGVFDHGVAQPTVVDEDVQRRTFLAGKRRRCHYLVLSHNMATQTVGAGGGRPGLGPGEAASEVWPIGRHDWPQDPTRYRSRAVSESAPRGVNDALGPSTRPVFGHAHTTDDQLRDRRARCVSPRMD
jgi:hypothetical protein